MYLLIHIKEKTLDEIIEAVTKFMEEFSPNREIRYRIDSIEFYLDWTKIYLDIEFGRDASSQILAMGREYFDKLDKVTNTNYRKGRSFEYRVMNKLRKYGWDCIRSFGSWGPADIRAFKEGTMLYIQCKWSQSGLTEPDHYELDDVVDLASQFGGIPIFAGIKNRRIYFVNLLTGEEYDIKN